MNLQNTGVCKEHKDHDHVHGPGCGHTAIMHHGHVDYLHDGHLHHPHQDHVDEHVIHVSRQNPDACTPTHNCGGHEKGHVHGPNCGHEAVPHGDHIDYIVHGHLHHPHGDHCDDHGSVQIVDAKVTSSTKTIGESEVWGEPDHDASKH